MTEEYSYSVGEAAPEITDVEGAVTIEREIHTESLSPEKKENQPEPANELLAPQKEEYSFVNEEDDVEPEDESEDTGNDLGHLQYCPEEESYLEDNWGDLPEPTLEDTACGYSGNNSASSGEHEDGRKRKYKRLIIGNKHVHCTGRLNRSFLVKYFRENDKSRKAARKLLIMKMFSDLSKEMIRLYFPGIEEGSVEFDRLWVEGTVNAASELERYGTNMEEEPSAFFYDVIRDRLKDVHDNSDELSLKGIRIEWRLLMELENKGTAAEYMTANTNNQSRSSSIVPLPVGENDQLTTFLSDWEMHELIKGLPQKERGVVSMHYYQGLTFEQIGKELEISEQEAEELHRSTLLKLRKMRLKRMKPRKLARS